MSEMGNLGVERKGTKQPKVPRRPTQFWAPLNNWWRSYLAEQNKRPVTGEVQLWFNENARSVWSDSERPTWKEARVHAKCLRSTEQVKNYFRAYRARRQGGASTDEATEARGEGEAAQVKLEPGDRGSDTLSQSLASHNASIARLSSTSQSFPTSPPDMRQGDSPELVFSNQPARLSPFKQKIAPHDFASTTVTSGAGSGGSWAQLPPMDALLSRCNSGIGAAMFHTSARSDLEIGKPCERSRSFGAGMPMWPHEISGYPSYGGQLLPQFPAGGGGISRSSKRRHTAYEQDECEVLPQPGALQHAHSVPLHPGLLQHAHSLPLQMSPTSPLLARGSLAEPSEKSPHNAAYGGSSELRLHSSGLLTENQPDFYPQLQQQQPPAPGSAGASPTSAARRQRTGSVSPGAAADLTGFRAAAGGSPSPLDLSSSPRHAAHGDAEPAIGIPLSWDTACTGAPMDPSWTLAEDGVLRQSSSFLPGFVPMPHPPPCSPELAPARFSSQMQHSQQQQHSRLSRCSTGEPRRRADHHPGHSLMPSGSASASTSDFFPRFPGQQPLGNWQLWEWQQQQAQAQAHIPLATQASSQPHGMFFHRLPEGQGRQASSLPSSPAQQPGRQLDARAPGYAPYGVQAPLGSGSRSTRTAVDVLAGSNLLAHSSSPSDDMEDGEAEELLAPQLHRLQMNSSVLPLGSRDLAVLDQERQLWSQQMADWQRKKEEDDALDWILAGAGQAAAAPEDLRTQQGSSGGGGADGGQRQQQQQPAAAAPRSSSESYATSGTSHGGHDIFGALLDGCGGAFTAGPSGASLAAAAAASAGRPLGSPSPRPAALSLRGTEDGFGRLPAGFAAAHEGSLLSPVVQHPPLMLSLASGGGMPMQGAAGYGAGPAAAEGLMEWELQEDEGLVPTPMWLLGMLEGGGHPAGRLG